MPVKRYKALPIRTLKESYPKLSPHILDSATVQEIWDQREAFRNALETIREIGYQSQASRATESVLACLRVAEDIL